MKLKISIVLVEPENPENIGSVAWAMKNMGLEDLRLVKPPLQWKKKGKKMAMSAVDVFQSANIFRSLQEALTDCHFVLGTTRRQGARRGAFLEFEKAIRLVQKNAKKYKVAILFGKESKGLSNRDLLRCGWITTIPAHENYPSLNLAQAVMVIVFSIFNCRRKTVFSENLQYASKKDADDMFKRFENALRVLEYQTEGGDVISRILSTLHGLTSRAGLLDREVQMLKGLSRRIVEKTRK